MWSLRVPPWVIIIFYKKDILNYTIQKINNKNNWGFGVLGASNIM